jgi:hypothetical protein
MDPATLTSLISSIGFPIVACMAMGHYVKYITDKNNANIAAMTEAHKQETESFVTALNNNTLALQKLSDMLDSRQTA